MAEEAKGYECLGGPMDGAVVGAAFLTKAGEHVCGIRPSTTVAGSGELATDLLVNQWADYLPTKRVRYKLDKAKRLQYVEAVK